MRGLTPSGALGAWWAKDRSAGRVWYRVFFHLRFPTLPPRQGGHFPLAAVLAAALAAALVSVSAAGTDETRWTEAWLRSDDVRAFQDAHPVAWDWLRQDGGGKPAPGAIHREMVIKAAREGGAAGGGLAAAIEAALQAGWADDDPRWAPLYARACEHRRGQRLAKLAATAPAIAFVKRQVIRPSFFAYTEGQSDAQHERHFLPGSSLWLMKFDGTRIATEQLLTDPTGVIRDPAVSWDGRRLAFAWKKSLNEDDYHLYELDLTTRALRQVTRGVGVADYEPAYLPDGGFVFSSSRCVQTVDCWWTEVSNLYTCDPAGRTIRRLGFDQVHTVYPQVLDDGRVIYTRWDYNDRGQVFPQPLFQMNPDGTNQREFYGNSSWFPTTIAHARGIPGTTKVLAILCGHHSSQAGKLAVIDPTLGRQENEGVQLVSPERETRAERIDSYGQKGELFAYPWPLNEREWITSYAPDGWDSPKGRAGGADFALYWMDRDGARELLATDPAQPCLQPVVVAPRPVPPPFPRRIDLTKTTGVYHIRDIYQGRGLAGVERGTIRALRVVALEYRSAGIRANHSGGPGGGALISTPVAVGNGTWDVKRVLGETPVEADGSACFEVPARTPLYFQALDARGRAVQTMRSWSTLQPGEVASCVGCHDWTNHAPPSQTAALAIGKPRQLAPAPGSGRGFSFAREIQPILDRHCVACHHHREPVLGTAAGQPPVLAQDQAARSPDDRRAFSLLGETIHDNPAGRAWSDSYLTLTQASRDGGKGAFRGVPDGRMVRWHGSQSVPTPLPPGFSGSIRSPLLDMLDQGHHGVRLTPAEYRALACWIDLFVPFCGDYAEANIWTAAEMEKFRHFEAKRLRFDDAAAPPAAR